VSNYLTGAGHFGIGFTLGFLIMILLYKVKKHNLAVQLHAAFVPFITGFIASLPYLFLEVRSSDPWLNFFLFYDLLHFNELAINLFGSLHLVTLLCGLMYLYILIRYIALVKHCRRYGWRRAF